MTDSRSPTDGRPATTARATYAWGTYTCDNCDQSTDRVWRDDGYLVCPDCKTW